MGLLSPYPHFIRLLLLSFIFITVQSTKVVLLNTSTTINELQWPIYPDSSDGWTEETVSNGGSNLRTFVTCNLDSDSPRSWLFLPRIDRKNTNGSMRIQMGVKYSLRKCELTNPERKENCKQSIEVWYRRYRGERGWDETVDTKKFHEDDWTLRTILHPVGRSDENEMTVSDATVEYTWDGEDEGLYLAFLDTGSCSSLMNIEVSYNVCAETISSLTHWNETAPHAEILSYISVYGICVENSEPEVIGKLPRAMCKSDGSWDVIDGCLCKAGFKHEDGLCKKCPFNQYSEMRNSPNCVSCPLRSNSNAQRTKCDCESGYYRLEDMNNVTCYAPPSKVQNLRGKSHGQKKIELEWDKPIDNGGLTKIEYEVKCVSCPKGIIMTVKERKATITGLEPNTEYVFRVTGCNQISTRHSLPVEWEEISVETDDLLSHRVEGIRRMNDIVETGDVFNLDLQWDPIIPIKNTATYQIEQVTESTGQKIYLTASTNSIQIPSLRKGVHYSFRVRSDSNGLGRWSQPFNYPSREETMGKGEMTRDWKGLDGIPLWVLLILIVMIVIAFLFIICFVRRSRSQNRKQMSDLDVLDTYKQVNAPLIPYGDVPTPKSASSHGAFSYGIPTNNRYKPYVDPLAYEDPNQALTEFACVIPPEAIRVTAVIGGGEFGDVCRASLNIVMLRRMDVQLASNTFDKEIETVACKTLKAGSSTKAMQDFLLEASIMGQFAHRNVVTLIGVVTKSEPVMIVAEFMENGSLDQFLRSRDARGDTMNMGTMIGMMNGIASGMKYLTEKGFVHRDLAARNVLVDEKLTCKISDFGLSRGVDKCVDQEYTTNGGKIPVRWTAPEAITHRKFTAASDVWSFGIVMWEVCSFGERPYWEWTNQKVISEIMAGYRLPAPMETPLALHRIMLRCWQLERHDRPTFSQLQSTLERLRTHPELVYLNENSGDNATNSSGDGRVNSMVNVSNPYGSVSVISPSPFIPSPPSSAPPIAPSLDEFLRSLRLGHCLDRLVHAGITRCDTLARMNHLEMLACGLISEEYQRIRDALSHLGMGPSSFHHHPSTCDRPPPPMRRGYTDTVATMPSMNGGRQREENGFFV
uniref:receptor protein-tyrosine kinase n=1 Tax=Pristionchus pacificus TaxID=54126 RepID=A0A2A6CJ41_PRIPA|eukprot:PDM78120.1 vab-1 [Pristionchus pacificus]